MIRTQTKRAVCLTVAVLFPSLLNQGMFGAHIPDGVETPPRIINLGTPQPGQAEILFQGDTGPFRLQMRTSMDSLSRWLDIPEAIPALDGPGTFTARFPEVTDPMAFFRVVSEYETLPDLKDWTVFVQVSAPANRSYFVPGERPLVAVSMFDALGRTLSLADFSTLSLYMFGPQDPQLTVTPVGLLNASADRAARPHHYIDLLTHPDVQVNGTVLYYPLQAVTDELPGTYTLSLRAAFANEPFQQVMKFRDLQIGTGIEEDPVVAKVRCAACHEGTISDKMYLHHIDPSGTRLGSWSLDFEPVKSCKSCHNNEGYAAFRDASVPGGRVPDPIVRRVHGVHNGSHLERTFNIDPDTGDFADYIHVEFPADVRNCTVCHLDDRYKTEPNRLACTGCHDSQWFGPTAETPVDMVAHVGGPQPDDSHCSLCHPADPGPPGLPISVSHQVPPPAFKHAVELVLTPPANGEFYVGGEAPQVTITFRDTTSGQIISPATIVEPVDPANVAPNEWRRANFYVSGPREHTVPVLTTAAEIPDPTHYYANNDLRVRQDPANEDPRLTRTTDSMVYQLDDVVGLEPGTYTAFVETMPAVPLGGWAYVNFQIGTDEPEPMVASNCTDCHRDTRQHAGYFAVTFTPDICKNCHDYERQTPGRITWTDANSGFGAGPLSRRIHGVHFGRYLHKPEEVHATHDYSHTIFPQDVRNCTKCHSQTDAWMEEPSRLACLACHDSDTTIVHASLMTFDNTPEDPWSGDEIETCVVCHGRGADFAPQIVHAIADPFVPPYPREPEDHEH